MFANKIPQRQSTPKRSRETQDYQLHCNHLPSSYGHVHEITVTQSNTPSPWSQTIASHAITVTQSTTPPPRPQKAFATNALHFTESNTTLFGRPQIPSPVTTSFKTSHYFDEDHTGLDAFVLGGQNPTFDDYGSPLKTRRTSMGRTPRRPARPLPESRSTLMEKRELHYSDPFDYTNYKFSPQRQEMEYSHNCRRNLVKCFGDDDVPTGNQNRFTSTDKPNDSTFASAAKATDSTFASAAKATDSTFASVAKTTDSTFASVAKATDSTFASVAKTTDNTFASVAKSTDGTFASVAKTTDEAFVSTTKGTDGTAKTTDESFVSTAMATDGVASRSKPKSVHNLQVNTSFDIGTGSSVTAISLNSTPTGETPVHRPPFAVATISPTNQAEAKIGKVSRALDLEDQCTGSNPGNAQSPVDSHCISTMHHIEHQSAMYSNKNSVGVPLRPVPPTEKRPWKGGPRLAHRRNVEGKRATYAAKVASQVPHNDSNCSNGSSHHYKPSCTLRNLQVVEIERILKNTNAFNDARRLEFQKFKLEEKDARYQIREADAKVLIEVQSFATTVGKQRVNRRSLFLTSLSTQDGSLLTDLDHSYIKMRMDNGYDVVQLIKVHGIVPIEQYSYRTLAHELCNSWKKQISVRKVIKGLDDDAGRRCIDVKSDQEINCLDRLLDLLEQDNYRQISKYLLPITLELQSDHMRVSLFSGNSKIPKELFNPFKIWYIKDLKDCTFVAPEAYIHYHHYKE